jgi:hypothetical protein
VACIGAVALLLVGCDQVAGLLKPDPGETARNRVDFVLKTLASGVSDTSMEMQTAICRWEADVVLVERDQLGSAMDAFDRWRRIGGFYDGIRSYTIDPEVDPADAGDPEGTVYVYATIDGSGRWMRVPPKQRISWVDEEE